MPDVASYVPLPPVKADVPGLATVPTEVESRYTVIKPVTGTVKVLEKDVFPDEIPTVSVTAV
jgi:hypothetical protein